MNSPAYKLEFDESVHEYKVAGDKKISTTTLLKRNGLYSNIQFATDEHLWRGKAIHEAMHYYHKRTLDFAKLDPLIVPYIQGWVSFERDFGFKALGWEQPLWHPLFDYCGTPDVWGQIANGDFWVMDYKHGLVPRVTGLQLASYGELLKINNYVPAGQKIHRVGIQMTAESDYRPRYFKDENDWGVWQMIVSVHNWGKNNV